VFVFSFIIVHVGTKFVYLVLLNWFILKGEWYMNHASISIMVSIPL